MGHIFISYSHKDKKYVEKLEEKLIREGFDVWIDHRIDYGSQWPKAIQRALDSCDAFVVVVSENAYESKWVQNEVARADRKKKPFFPLLLQGDPWLSVETTQYVDVTDKSLPVEKFYELLSLVVPKAVKLSYAEIKEPSLHDEIRKTLSIKPRVRTVNYKFPILNLFRSKSVLCPYCLTENRYRTHLWECLRCKMDLPPQYINNYSNALPLFMLMVGHTAVGKSVYLQTLILMLRQLNRIFPDNYVCSPITETTRYYLKDALIFQETGEMPVATLPLQVQKPLMLLLQGMERWGSRTLVMQDIAGEFFNDFSSIPPLYINYLTHTPAILMMISLTDIDNRAIISIDDLLNQYIQTLSRHRPDFQEENRKVIVVLSKADKLRDKLPTSIQNYLVEDPFSNIFRIKRTFLSTDATHFMNSYMGRLVLISDELLKWIEQQPDGKNLVALAKRNNIDIQFTIVSSLGTSPANNKLLVNQNPYRVLDPFFLLLDAFSRP